MLEIVNPLFVDVSAAHPEERDFTNVGLNPILDFLFSNTYI
jgi:hypothetical protein